MADMPEQVRNFEDIKQVDGGDDYWSARDLMPLLGYDRWENFTVVIGKAETACERSGYATTDHFRKVTKMIETGKNAVRPVDDYRLTRYAEAAENY
jgi:DNA-damage-inducible protein D